MPQKETIGTLRKESSRLPQHESDDEGDHRDVGTSTQFNDGVDDAGVDMADETDGDAKAAASKQGKQVDGEIPDAKDHVHQRTAHPLKRAGVFSKLFFW